MRRVTYVRTYITLIYSLDGGIYRIILNVFYVQFAHKFDIHLYAECLHIYAYSLEDENFIGKY